VSLLTRLSASTASTELAHTISALLSSMDTSAPRELALAAPPRPAARATGGLPFAPNGLGTVGLRVPPHRDESAAQPVSTPATIGPTGPGTEGLRIAARREGGAVPELYCPPAVRDDPALGEAVNERLIEWAEDVGIYPGQLDRVRSANFGRLIMLTHPETDDADRLLAAAKCALAEWSVDDHYVDGVAADADPELLGQRLAIAYAAIDPAHLPVRYAPELERELRDDPVMVALRNSLDNLANYATAAQVARLRHELSVMFVAYNQEAVWRRTGQTPPVWEYLLHRHENSFLPCMVLIDPVAGYELPPAEFAEPRIRRAFTIAGLASVLVNDLYSMAKEDPTDTNLPRVVAAQERCSLAEAVQRSVAIHDEAVRTFETEAAALSLVGSPALRRFLAGVWAWLGGNREWHATSGRYNSDSQP
jgi:2-methylisoborneol synthase